VAHDRRRLLCLLHVRHHDARGAHVERRQQQDIKRIAIERGMLGIDDHKIEFGRLEHLDYLIRRCLDEDAHQRLARNQALPKRCVDRRHLLFSGTTMRKNYE